MKSYLEAKKSKKKGMTYAQAAAKTGVGRTAITAIMIMRAAVRIPF